MGEAITKGTSAMRTKRVGLTACFFCVFFAAHDYSPAEDSKKTRESAKTEVATFGGGCFWCVEAVFLELKGVVSVESGYSGGTIANPTYKQVLTGETGHAEVCQVHYDPARVSYDKLLEVFWKTHDPTTLNRQGPDVGPQYRSVIFFHSKEQQTLAEKYKKALNDAGAFKRPIVTEVSAVKKFYKAEDYHQNYFKLNPRQPYCRFVIGPKVSKFRKVFKADIKK